MTSYLLVLDALTPAPLPLRQARGGAPQRSLDLVGHNLHQLYYRTTNNRVHGGMRHNFCRCTILYCGSRAQRLVGGC